MTSRYFLTVDWCDKGHRGIFCDEDGKAFAKDGEPHTQDEMWGILDAFSMVLAPESRLFSEEDVKEYTRWIPLEEFSNVYGVALKGLERKGENDNGFQM